MNKILWYSLINFWALGLALNLLAGTIRTENSGSGSIGVGNQGSGTVRFDGTATAAAAGNCSGANVETTDLVAYYRFEEGVGTSVNDESSGGTHDITLFNTPTWPAGNCGNGLNVASASTEYGTAAAPPIIGDDDTFSICVWFKSTQAVWGSIYTEGRTTNDNPLMDFGISGSVAGDIVFGIRDDTGAQSVDYVTADVNADDGNWHHACIVQSAGNARQIYFDGAASGAGNTTDVSATRTVDNSEIGRLERTSASDYYNGDMDQLRIYSSALTSTQVGNIFAYEN